MNGIKKRIVVYTAIFGGYDQLISPDFISKDCDYICFTDGEIVSDVWKIVKVDSIPNDPVRSARKCKILAHRYLPEYEFSVWVDGNLKIIGDVSQLIDKYLKEVNMAVYDHAQNRYNLAHTKLQKLFHLITLNSFNKENVNCLYKELNLLLDLNKSGKFKEDSNLMIKQVETYKKEGYPKNNGMIISMAMVRRHNSKDVIKVMEDWWAELLKFSRRDQLSFNYVAWKNDFKFVFIKGDSRRNKYFYHYKHKKLKKDEFKS